MCTYKLLEQYIAYLRIWQRCNWGKVGEVWTAWLHLLIQNQVVEPHNKKSNQNKPRIFGVILIWFLSCGCTTWFCLKRFIHMVNTSPTFPQNVHIQVGQTSQTRYCKPTKISSLSEQRYNFCKFAIDFLSCGCAVWSGIQRLSHIVCTALTFPQNGSHVHVQVAQTRYCKAAKVAFLKFQCIRAHLVNTQQWTNTILSNTSRGNMWGTVQQVLFATNVLWESQMSTSWRNTCNSTLNRSVLFVKRNSMPERTWKGTHRYMKCKGVKNVENGSAARKSTDRTDKPTKRKQMMTRRLTYLELI